jgi:hypothetical protein
VRTCPNRHCRTLHGDAVNQCPECGANMSRTPDAVLDPNMELYAARDRAMRETSLEQQLKNGSNGSFAPAGVQDSASELAGVILGLYKPQG